ncbi:MAG: hypothetical protein M3Z07_00030 [Candidatus Eremiobacteraeota bacterium]|nr:hypothetical protein [Candidatus Eremiobacteraeota bacterium]
MRRFMITTLIMSGVIASCYAPAAARTRVAPADEYFGRMKMSILGVGNSLRDLAAKAERQAARPENLTHDAMLAEDAVHDWEAKYPRDPWLAKDVAKLVHIYSEVGSDSGRARMHACLNWLEHRYRSHQNLIAAERVEVAFADSRLRGLSRR